MYSLRFVQWDFTRRDHPGNLGRVSGSGLVTTTVLASFLGQDVASTHLDT